MTADSNSAPSAPAASEALSNPAAQSGSAPPAPMPPASDSAAAAPDEVASTDSPGEASDEAQRQKIKIGTQRPGVAVPRVEPRTKVAYRTSPTQQPPVAKPTTEGRAASPRPSHPSPLPRGEGAEEGTPLTPPVQFKAAPRKPRFEVTTQPVGKVEKPNLRAALPPELEAELQEAMGQQPLDEMIGTETAGAETRESLESESRHQARVLRIFRDNVFVELPGGNQGALVLHQLPAEPEVGAVIDVNIVRFNAEDGLYELTAFGASVDVGDWSDLAEGITVEANITGHNKGGLECEVNKIRGFIPAGQISIYRVENFEEFVGQRWPCVVVEANPERRNLVLSRRALLEREQAEAKEKLLAELEVGQEREGTVRNIRDFGAFVDLGGIDGMIHVSQMSWDRIKHPSEVLTLGQKVKVKIQKIDPETHKISLAYRDLFESPWTTAATKYPVTTRVTGTVSKIMDFGAFVKLEPGVEGLVHISELSYKRVHRVGDIVKEGQQVDAKVLSVDPENQRISLSMKAFEARPETARKDEPEPEPESPAAPEKKRKRAVPLQGGLGRSPQAEKFGLNW